MNLENLQKLLLLLNKVNQKQVLQEKELESLEQNLFLINELEGWKIESKEQIFGFYSTTLYSIWRDTVDIDGVPLKLCIINAPLSIVLLWLFSQGMLFILNSKLTTKKLEDSYDLDLF